MYLLIYSYVFRNGFLPFYEGERVIYNKTFENLDDMNSWVKEYNDNYSIDRIMEVIKKYKIEKEID